MPIYLQHKDEEMGWGIWHMTESQETLRELWNTKNQLGEEVPSFKNETRQKEWITVRLLLLNLLNRKSKIIYDNNGRPSLDNSNFQISISHTKNFAAFAYSSKSKIGIDIEKNSDKVFSVKERFMNTSELQQIDNDNLQTSLLIHWATKESLYKIVGNVGGTFRDNFYLHQFKVEENGSFIVDFTCDNKIRDYLVDYLVDPEFVFTIIAASRQ